MRSERTFYQVLQVDPEAEPEVIEAAYRRLARKYHPDVSSASDSGTRMKGINAAYEVLRDPLRRAAYNRDLHRVADDDDELMEDAEHDDTLTSSQQRPLATFACRIHPGASVVGPCSDCGAWLCGECFERFQPPTCSPCMLTWAGQRRTQLLLPVIWFAGVILLLGWLVLEAERAAVGHTPLEILGAELAAVYLIASLPSGWRVMQVFGADEDENVGMMLLWAAVLGPVVAPFRIGKTLWDLRRLGELEALARVVE